MGQADLIQLLDDDDDDDDKDSDNVDDDDNNDDDDDDSVARPGKSLAVAGTSHAGLTGDGWLIALIIVYAVERL